MSDDRLLLNVYWFLFMVGGNLPKVTVHLKQCLYISFPYITSLIRIGHPQTYISRLLKTTVIVRDINFLQAFEKYSPFAAYKPCPAWVIKYNWSRIIQKYPDGLYLRLLFYQLAKFDGMRLKTERILILCIVVVFAKTCFGKFAPKVHHLFHDLIPAKTLVRHILQTIRRIEKNFFWLHLMYILFLRKSQFRYIDPIQHERKP